MKLQALLSKPDRSAITAATNKISSITEKTRQVVSPLLARGVKVASFTLHLGQKWSHALNTSIQFTRKASGQHKQMDIATHIHPPEETFWLTLVLT